MGGARSCWSLLMGTQCRLWATRLLPLQTPPHVILPSAHEQERDHPDCPQVGVGSFELTQPVIGELASSCPGRSAPSPSTRPPALGRVNQCSWPVSGALLLSLSQHGIPAGMSTGLKVGWGGMALTLFPAPLMMVPLPRGPESPRITCPTPPVLADLNYMPLKSAIPPLPAARPQRWASVLSQRHSPASGPSFWLVLSERCPILLTLPAHPAVGSPQLLGRSLGPSASREARPFLSAAVLPDFWSPSSASGPVST